MKTRVIWNWKAQKTAIEMTTALWNWKAQKKVIEMEMTTVLLKPKDVMTVLATS